MVDEGVKGRVYVFGLDLGKVRDPTVLILLDVDVERKHVTVRHIDEYPGMEYSNQIGHILQLPRRFAVVGGTVDMTGVGQAVCEDLLKDIPGSEGLTFTQQSKADMANLAKKYFEEGRITIPNNPKLIMQLNNLSYKFSKGGHLLFDNVQQRFHDDYAWSLFLAIWAAEKIIKRGADSGRNAAIFVDEDYNTAEPSDEEGDADAWYGPLDVGSVLRG